jgi:hypothetical protein
MSTDAADPAAPQDPAAARADKRLLRLDELAELGMQLARDLVREQAARAQAAEAGEAAPPARIDPGLAFARISRAVRLTLALEARFDEGRFDKGLPAPAPAPASAPAPTPPRPPTPHERAEERRETIAFYVQDAAYNEYDASEHEQLEEDIREVLDAFEDETINDRPIGEVVEEICKALGVVFDFTLHSWRELEVPPERCRARPMAPALAALIHAPP